VKTVRNGVFPKTCAPRFGRVHRRAVRGTLKYSDLQGAQFGAGSCPLPDRVECIAQLAGAARGIEAGLAFEAMAQRAEIEPAAVIDHVGGRVDPIGGLLDRAEREGGGQALAEVYQRRALAPRLD